MKAVYDEMSISLEGSFDLLDGIYKEGLPFVASYLEKHIHSPIIITNDTGNIHYSTLPEITNGKCIPLKLSSNQNYSYLQSERSLYYPIVHNRILGFIIVKGLHPNHVAETISILSDAQTPLTWYFLRITQVNESTKALDKSMSKYFFQKADTDFKNNFQESYRTIDLKIPYFVSVVKIDNTGLTDDIKKFLNPFTKQYFQTKQPEIIIMTCSDCYVLFIPANMEGQASRVGSSDIKLLNIKKYKEIVENNYNVTLSIGVGQTYPLPLLRQSFQEAQIVLTLNRLMEKKGLVQEFEKLGIYYFIFSSGVQSIKDYCLKNLGPLIQYDNVTGSDLLSTLRTVLDCNYNLKSASDHLFIHINTVHYRLKKIEQLLNIDLSAFNNRLELYTVIKVWDTLKIHSYADVDPESYDTLYFNENSFV